MNRHLCVVSAFLLACVFGLPVFAQMDHSSFIQNYEGAKTCEGCHSGMVAHIQTTVHYKFESDVPEGLLFEEDGVTPREIQQSGKLWKLCGFPTTVPQFNWMGNLKDDPTTPHIDKPGGCAKCHIGVGYKPYTATGLGAPAENEAYNVDCLVCHAENYTRKLYAGEMNGAAVVMAAPIVDGALDFSGMTEAAKTVGKPKSEYCNRCHAAAGGGKVKLDDMEYSFKRGSIYDESHDVHATAGMSCVDCHALREFVGDHRTKRNPNNDISAFDALVEEQLCLSCHSESPHEDGSRYNSHAEFISCTGCHATSEGGAINKDFSVTTEPDPNDPLGLYGVKVDFADDTFRLEFHWFNGTVKGKIEPIGSKGNGKIYPYKTVTFNQPIDENGHPIPIKWGVQFKTGNMQEAINQGLAAYAAMMTDEIVATKGLPPVPGAFAEFKERSDLFSISHGITKEKALNCSCCHSENGLLDFESLGFSAQEAATLESFNFGDDCARGVPSSGIDQWTLFR